MTYHTEVINYLIKEKGLKSYLEIGVYNKDHNFNKIECATKIGVDPDPRTDADFIMTSDRFFSLVHNLYDIVFIDGLHHSDQVRKDLKNAMRQLNDGGFIVLHDTNPHSESITHVPRDTGEWCGDVYKVITQMDESTNMFMSFPFDYGITIVKKHDLSFTKESATWEDFSRNRIWYLNIKNVEQFKEWI